MKFALVQMNPTVGAVAENAGKIVQAAEVYIQRRAKK